MQLTDEQTAALDTIKKWYNAGPTGPFRLFGCAGVGKTTLAREVGPALGLSHVMYAAYTGKAASVLRGKGCTPASTLHSLIYRPQPGAATRDELAAAIKRRDELEDYIASGELVSGVGHGVDDDLRELHKRIATLEKQSKVLGFVINDEGPLAFDPPDLLILDEVSMVDGKLAADLETFGIPLLVLGDPEQLEPVGGEGHYTSGTPDVLLTEIHRQALQSPVLRLATSIRLGETELLAGRIQRHTLALAAEHDQVLCWKNSTRWLAVRKLRELAGLGPIGQVVPGDRIMCLTNNKDLGVFNGQQFTVTDAEPGTLGPRLSVVDEEGRERDLLAYIDGFQGQKEQETAKNGYVGGKGLRGLFTYAQCITVHKAQGSEWDSVYVVDETPGMVSMKAKRVGVAAAKLEAQRWLYTAVSRASNKVTVVRTSAR